jgi:aryl-phospho-beta-D-glucosidase BglC (GH1 family)
MSTFPSTSLKVKWVAITLVATAGWAGAASGELQPERSNGEGDLNWIQLAEEGTRFLYAGSGDEFVVWGVNYDHDETGRLLEDYWVEEWTTIAEDFREIKALGANTVRIHLQFAKFMEGPDTVNDSELNRHEDLIKMADETGVYLKQEGIG